MPISDYPIYQNEPQPNPFIFRLYNVTQNLQPAFEMNGKMVDTVIELQLQYVGINLSRDLNNLVFQFRAGAFNGSNELPTIQTMEKLSQKVKDLEAEKKVLETELAYWKTKTQLKRALPDNVRRLDK